MFQCSRCEWYSPQLSVKRSHLFTFWKWKWSRNSVMTLQTRIRARSDCIYSTVVAFIQHSFASLLSPFSYLPFWNEVLFKRRIYRIFKQTIIWILGRLSVFCVVAAWDGLLLKLLCINQLKWNIFLYYILFEETLNICLSRVLFVDPFFHVVPEKTDKQKQTTAKMMKCQVSCLWSCCQCHQQTTVMVSLFFSANFRGVCPCTNL